MNPDVSIVIAFGAGLLSFFSPCVIPLVPSYISLLMGEYAETGGKQKLLLSSLIFITGFSLVFITLGLSASFIGQLLIKNKTILNRIGGLIIVFFGVHLAGIIDFKFLYREKRLELKNKNKYLRPLVMGFIIAFAWTPCVGPVLSSILIYAGTKQTILQGGILLAFYSLGFAIPFLLGALSLDWILPKFNKIKPYLPGVQKTGGVLLILLGIAIFTGYFRI